MALTARDKEIIKEIASNIKQGSAEDSTSRWELIAEIKAQTTINTQIFDEIRAVGTNMGNIATSLNNGITEKINTTAEKVENIEFEVKDKDGALNKLYSKLNYFWIPWVGSIIGIILIIIKISMGSPI